MSPQSIKLNGPGQTVVVEWPDGHRSAYPYQYLRDRCPCAACTGAHGGPAPPAAGLLPILGTQTLKPSRAELVGRYALQFFWSDGHSSGIYTFDYLRGLCPCEPCSARRDVAE
jgi:DUF971 family protein